MSRLRHRSVYSDADAPTTQPPRVLHSLPTRAELNDLKVDSALHPERSRPTSVPPEGEALVNVCPHPRCSGIHSQSVLTPRPFTPIQHLRIADRYLVVPATTYLGAEFQKVLKNPKVEYRQANLGNASASGLPDNLPENGRLT